MALLSWQTFRGSKSMSPEELKQESLKMMKSEAPSKESEGFVSAENILKADVEKLNEASTEDLLAIKGVGPKTAVKVQESGPYVDFDDFQAKVKLHPTIVGRIADWISA